MNKTLGQCLEHYRTELGWGKTQASGETDFVVSSQQIGKFESGAIKSPGWQHVMLLLKAYGINPDQLANDMEGLVSSGNRQTHLATVTNTIPVIDIEHVQAFVDGLEFDILDKIYTEPYNSTRVFAVKVGNDLMDAPAGTSYPKGSIVIFDAAKPYVDNKDVLLSHDGTIVFRRFFKEGKKCYLKHLNTNYSSTNVDEKDIKIIARAIECRTITK